VYSVGIITASDKGSIGEREDVSGKLIEEIVVEHGYQVVHYIVLPDDRTTLKNEMIHMADELNLNLIITTGGTGFSQRDITPEASLEVIERNVPGIAEAMRMNSYKITPRAILSRGVAGIRGKTLIINLPGSPKAVKESLEFIIDQLDHGIKILIGEDSECAR
jgi:molybdenum cofactor synthesis domain-containing protein